MLIIPNSDVLSMVCNYSDGPECAFLMLSINLDGGMVTEMVSRELL